MGNYRAIVATAWMTAVLGCGGVRLADLEAPRPAPAGACVVVGLLGGLDAWDESDKGVRRLALALRDPGRGVYAETFENRRMGVARRFALQTLDRDGDGMVAAAEAERVRLVVYGQSLGGWAAVRLARLLAADGVPLDLLVLIDSVGWSDGTIPANVRRAANLYQDDGLVIQGEHPLRPADTTLTDVVGEWEYEYDEPPGSEIEVGELPWHKLAFRAAHAKMDRDPRVWRRVETLVNQACEGGQWRERVGIEPTSDATRAPDDGFEDRRGHQTPSAPGRNEPTARGLNLGRLDNGAERTAGT